MMAKSELEKIFEKVADKFDVSIYTVADLFWENEVSEYCSDKEEIEQELADIFANEDY